MKNKYCEDNGRPSIDPVVLFKIAIIQYVFGIKSMRQTIAEIENNIAYRWFLGYGLSQSIPHFTTFGKNYVRRFKDADLKLLRNKLNSFANLIWSYANGIDESPVQSGYFLQMKGIGNSNTIRFDIEDNKTAHKALAIIDGICLYAPACSTFLL